VLHDFGVFQRFGFDAMDGREIDRFLGVRAGDEERDHDDQAAQKRAGCRFEVHRIELKP
jgi:hypothetical protein